MGFEQGDEGTGLCLLVQLWALVNTMRPNDSVLRPYTLLGF